MSTSACSGVFVRARRTTQASRLGASKVTIDGGGAVRFQNEYRLRRKSDAPASGLVVKVGTSIAEAERRLVLATLEHFQGDKKKTASVLKISLKTLYNRLNVYHAGG